MWWSLFRLLLAGTGVALTTYVLDRTAERLVRRFAPHRPGSVMPGMLRSCRRPLVTVLATSLSLAVQPWVGGSPETREQLHHLLVLLAIASGGWLGARAVGLVVEGAVRLAVHRRDPSSAGRARTQAGLLGRICQAIIAIAALGAMLMTFPSVRGIGTSLLASAGLVGVVAGIAAQSVLANLFAGVQLAFGDLVRIGDVVVVSGEWGTVEEITLTAVVIATWDQRRLVMPMSYFAGRPFENGRAAPAGSPAPPSSTSTTGPRSPCCARSSTRSSPTAPSGTARAAPYRSSTPRPPPSWSGSWRPPPTPTTRSPSAASSANTW
ncbi:mechanosensitive ion channel domain-containing protein [Kitasatospora sp. NPDC056731]|uniref:mechanosensitive ion channel family protein n=1 Tax=Kitasatospora sp. NPDC056731 TaxID=3155422 RepID=UPI003430205B